MKIKRAQTIICALGLPANVLLSQNGWYQAPSIKNKKTR
jgi:hypothetical protein